MSDQFFTKPAIARRCWDWIHGLGVIPPDAIYIEPSVGGGAFWDLMPAGRAMGYEIDERLAAAKEHEGVVRQDFLEITPLIRGLWPDKPRVVIGNPPFGKGGRLALAFIRQAFELHAHYAAFILPSTFHPFIDGTPPAAERQLRGLCHSIACLRDLGDEYDLPDGGVKLIRGCAMVLYKAGGRPLDRSRPACESYARLYNIQPGQGQDAIGRCDLFIQESTRHGSIVKHGLRPHRRKPPGGDVYIGIEILRDKERLIEHLLGYDWLSAGKIATNQNRIISQHAVRLAIMDGGFIDEPQARSCASWADVFSVNKKAGRGLGKGDAVYIPHMVLLGSRSLTIQLYDEIITNEMIGVRPLKEPERVLAYLRSLRPDELARRSTNNCCNVSCASVRQALIRGGFVDGREPSHRSCDGYAEIYHIDKRGTGLARVPETDVFIAKTTPHGSSVKSGVDCSTSLLDHMSQIGVRVMRDKDAVIEYLLNYDWLAIASTSTDGRRLLRIKHIQHALIEGGFVDDVK